MINRKHASAAAAVFAASLLAVASSTAMAAIVCNTATVPIAVPQDGTGIYLNLITGASGTSGSAVGGWDFNPYDRGLPGISFWFANDANKGALWDAVRHLILPAIVLGTIPLAVIARMTRSSMLEVLREDYVRTARAKGLSPFRIIFIHALRNALVPVLTVIGLQVGTLMGGAVLTETIFSWPGIGKWLIDAIGRRDYPVVQNGILLVATLVILTNFVVDILYGVANPRILHQR